MKTKFFSIRCSIFRIIIVWFILQSFRHILHSKSKYLRLGQQIFYLYFQSSLKKQYIKKLLQQQIKMKVIWITPNKENREIRLKPSFISNPQISEVRRSSLFFALLDVITGHKWSSTYGVSVCNSSLDRFIVDCASFQSVLERGARESPSCGATTINISEAQTHASLRSIKNLFTI